MMDIVLAIIGSSAFTCLVNGIIELFKMKSSKKTSVDKGVMFSLLFALQTYGEKLLAQDSIDLEDYKQFSEMYHCYKKDFNGNGYAERVKAEVDKKPIRTSIKYHN